MVDWREIDSNPGNYIKVLNIDKDGTVTGHMDLDRFKYYADN